MLARNPTLTPTAARRISVPCTAPQNRSPLSQTQHIDGRRGVTGAEQQVGQADEADHDRQDEYRPRLAGVMDGPIEIEEREDPSEQEK